MTPKGEGTPPALLHNLKHNRVPEAERIQVEEISPDFKRMTVTYGFMETPNLPAAFAQVRRGGLKFDITSTTFFLSRRSLVPSPNSGLPLWRDNIFIWMARNAGSPANFFRLPAGRVVEMGTQVQV